MLYRRPTLQFIGGRLALDFVNMIPLRNELSWDQLIEFLQSARIVTPERGVELLALNRSDPQAAESLLRKAQRLAAALRLSFEPFCIGKRSCVNGSSRLTTSSVLPKDTTNSLRRAMTGRFSSLRAKAVSSGCLPQWRVRRPKLLRKVPAHACASAPIPGAACFSVTLPALTAAAGAR